MALNRRRWVTWAMLSMSVKAAWAQTPSPAWYSKLPRMALVIGNARYSGSLAALPSAVSDARLMDDTLKQLGFAVQRETDLSPVQIESAVTAFARRVAQSGALSIIYLSGHGASVGDSIRFLAANSGDVRTDADILRQSVGLPWMLAEMATYRSASGRVYNPIILIADIDTHVWTDVTGAAPPPQTSDLYVALQREDHTNVMLPNAIGKRAALTADGTHRLFTRHLAHALVTPGATLADVSGVVHQAVGRSTGQSVSPEWIYRGAVSRNIAFTSGGGLDDPKGRGRSARVM